MGGHQGTHDLHWALTHITSVGPHPLHAVCMHDEHYQRLCTLLLAYQTSTIAKRRAAVARRYSPLPDLRYTLPSPPDAPLPPGACEGSLACSTCHLIFEVRGGIARPW